LSRNQNGRLGVCKFCHRTENREEHSFRLFREGGELCATCHWEQTTRGDLHLPVAAGDCLTCHNPHASDYAFLLTMAPRELCLSCHGPPIEGNSHLHAPVETGGCTGCHDAHGSECASLLDRSEEDLCLSCHETVQRELAELDVVHLPIRESGCRGCHEPHGADNPKFLKTQVPELCFDCHEEIRQVILNAKHTHVVAGEKHGCVHCHSPHASGLVSRLRDTPMVLCLSCHDKKLKTRGGEMLADLQSDLDSSQFFHAPVEGENCHGCHVPHGSDHFRMLIAPYPDEFYAPFDLRSYGLCFTCHEQEMVLTKETETDEVTAFRNGSVNLHYLHVNDPKKGRTCRACHATHGSRLRKLIREQVNFGGWELPVSFDKTETGGSCEPGCHNARGYDRVKKVINLPGEAPGNAKAPGSARAPAAPRATP